jgi:hypothetical protein
MFVDRHGLQRTMASKTSRKRTGLKPEPVVARAKRAVAAARPKRDARKQRAAKAKPARTTPSKSTGKSKSRRPRSPSVRVPANSNIPTSAEIAAEAAFAKKGTASAAAFRPWYWHY